jgi:hypothetical protein
MAPRGVMLALRSSEPVSLSLGDAKAFLCSTFPFGQHPTRTVA